MTETLQAPLSKLLRDTPNTSAALKPAVYKGLRGTRCMTLRHFNVSKTLYLEYRQKDPN